MYYEIIDVDGYPLTDGSSVILKEKGFDINVENYEIEFYIILKPSKMFEIAKWCSANIDGTWLVGSDHSGFNIKEDAMAFKLRWI